MSSIRLIDGVPHLHNIPALDAGEDPLDLFSKWRCPFCKCRLSKNPPHICLNACHLTAPELTTFVAGMSDANRGRTNEI